MWSTEKTLTLIDLLRNLPALWDITSEDYKNRMKKTDAHQEIAEKLSVDANEVEKKIKTLKIQFRREYLKIILQLKNGNLPKKCAWFGYEPLQFLLQAQQFKGNLSAAHSPLLDEDSHMNPLDEDCSNGSTLEDPLLGTSNGPARDEYSVSANFRVVKKPRKDTILNGSHQMTQKLLELINLKDTKIEDEFYHFGNNVASQLRELPLREALLCESAILDIVTKHRLAAVDTKPVFSEIYKSDDGCTE